MCRLIVAIRLPFEEILYDLIVHLGRLPYNKLKSVGFQMLQTLVDYKLSVGNTCADLMDDGQILVLLMIDRLLRSLYYNPLQA